MLRGFVIAAVLTGLGLWTARSRTASVDRGIGAALAHATLRDLSGHPIRVKDLMGDRATVLVFMGIDCPLGNLYMPHLVELAESFRNRGVTFIGINSNTSESAGQVQSHAREFQATFPVLKDPANVVADLTQVQRTCETIVLDAGATVRYRGAIDDQYAATRHRDRPTRHYLTDALEDILADRAVVLSVTPVVGCPIQRTRPSSDQVRLSARPAPPQAIAARQDSNRQIEVGQVTYSGDVAPILLNRCQACHRPGQIGRFSLQTFKQARRWAQSIHEVVEEGRMPPWHADPRFGRFANDRSLDAREHAVLLAWVEQGTPAGDLTTGLRPAGEADSKPAGVWGIGEPDAIFSMPEAFEVPSSGAISYQHFRVPTGFTEDRWMQAAEVRPGDATVVHHINVYIEASNRNKSDARHVNPQLVFFAPGDMPVFFPPGTAKRIPAHSVLDIVVHYTPIGTPRVDRSSVALIFARQPVTREARTISISCKDFAIPPGVGNFEVRAQHSFDSEVYLLSMTPHMHLRGKDFRYDVTFPDGRRQTLLSVPAYDFAWQTLYRLAEPLRMPPGTRLDCTAHFDNSAANPANPDPTKTVSWGDQTWDEMMIGFTDYAVDLGRPVIPPGANRPSALTVNGPK
jgi:peroxiredoxin